MRLLALHYHDNLAVHPSLRLRQRLLSLTKVGNSPSAGNSKDIMRESFT